MAAAEQSVAPDRPRITRGKEEPYGDHVRVIIDIPSSIWFLGIGHSNTNSTDSMASTAMLKRARVDDEGEGAGGDRRQVMAISAEGKDQGGMGSRAVVMREVKRTSGLEAPIVSLAGAHQVS